MIKIDTVIQSMFRITKSFSFIYRNTNFLLSGVFLLLSSQVFAIGTATLINPSNGIAISENKPCFYWNKASGATRYSLQVSATGDFTSGVRWVLADLTSTSACWSTAFGASAAAGGITPSELTVGNTYYWRVKAMDNVTANATAITFSSTNSFTVKYPTCTSITSGGANWWSCDGKTITPYAYPSQGSSISEFNVVNGYATWKESSVSGSIYTSGSYQYFSSSIFNPNRTAITPRAAYDVYSYDSISYFSVKDGYATWLFEHKNANAPGSSSSGYYAYYSSPVANPTGGTLVTQTAEYGAATSGGSITEFNVQNGYMTWKFATRYGYAYYYKCYSGSQVQITPYVNTPGSAYISNFKVVNNQASWSFYNGSTTTPYVQAVGACQ